MWPNLICEPFLASRTGKDIMLLYAFYHIKCHIISFYIIVIWHLIITMNHLYKIAIWIYIYTICGVRFILLQLMDANGVWFWLDVLATTSPQAFSKLGNPAAKNFRTCDWWQLRKHIVDAIGDQKKRTKAQGADFLGSNETQTHKTSPFILGSCVIDHWTTSVHLTKRDQWHKAASCALAKPDVCKHSCSPCLDGCQFTKSGQPLIKGSDGSDGQKHPQVQTMAHFFLLNHALLGAQYYF